MKQLVLNTMETHTGIMRKSRAEDTLARTTREGLSKDACFELSPECQEVTIFGKEAQEEAQQHQNKQTKTS